MAEGEVCSRKQQELLRMRIGVCDVLLWMRNGVGDHVAGLCKSEQIMCVVCCRR